MQSMHQDVLSLVLILSFKPDEFQWDDAADFRTRLCLVCRHWRDVVYVTSELWASIPITPIHTTDFLHFVLQRSSGRDLNVFLRACPFRASVGRYMKRPTPEPWTYARYFAETLDILALHYG